MQGITRAEIIEVIHVLEIRINKKGNKQLFGVYFTKDGEKIGEFAGSVSCSARVGNQIDREGSLTEQED